jgi:PKD repeat protein
MQKLRGVGYSDIRIVNNTDTEIPVDLNPSGTNNDDDNELPAASVLAKLVEITYRTASAPSEIKTGYYLLTATNVTPQDLGTISGYGIFYEGASSPATTPPAPVNQVFSSFELIASPEIAETILAAIAAQEELAEQSESEEQTVQTTQTEDVVGEDITPLTGELIASDTEGVAPATFEFEADITGGKEPYTISWDLDDDGIAESNEQTLVVTFNEAGTYDGVLIVTDSKGQTASDTVEITVEEGEEVASTEEEEELPSIEDEEESLTEETTQEETSCDSLYPISCIPSNPQLNNLLDLYGSRST